jgi:hypothetical protein
MRLCVCVCICVCVCVCGWQQSNFGDKGLLTFCRMYAYLPQQNQGENYSLLGQQHSLANEYTPALIQRSSTPLWVVPLLYSFLVFTRLLKLYRYVTEWYTSTASCDAMVRTEVWDKQCYSSKIYCSVFDHHCKCPQTIITCKNKNKQINKYYVDPSKGHFSNLKTLLQTKTSKPQT